MPSFDDFKTQLSQYLLGTEQERACLEIVAMLESRKIENLRMLTYSSFSKETNRDLSDPYLVLAINFLVVSKEFKLLDKHYLVMSSDRQASEEADDEEIAQAYRSGSLSLPDGVVVEDFENYLLPYFTPSNALRELREDECPR